MGKIILFKKKKYTQNLLINGDFVTSDNWIEGVGITISNYKCQFLDAPSGSNLTQNNIFVIGKKYLLTVEASDDVKGAVRISPTTDGIGNTRINTNGIFSFVFTATSTDLFLSAYGTTTISLDNISIRKIL